MSDLDEQVENYAITQQVAREARQMLRETRALERVNADLLEALQRLVDCYSSSHSPETRESCWAQARAAIKKATT